MPVPALDRTHNELGRFKPAPFGLDARIKDLLVKSRKPASQFVDSHFLYLPLPRETKVRKKTSRSKRLKLSFASHADLRQALTRKCPELRTVSVCAVFGAVQSEDASPTWRLSLSPG